MNRNFVLGQIPLNVEYDQPFCIDIKSTTGKTDCLIFNHCGLDGLAYDEALKQLRDAIDDYLGNNEEQP